MDEAMRHEAGRLMDVLVKRRGRVHYAQVRPMQTIVGPRAIKRGKLWLALSRPGGVTMDCSESVTLIAHLAGWRDPNGLHYNGTGFTGTLLKYLEHYEEPSRAETGALVVFGGGTGEHVAMVRHQATDPVLFSHGKEADPHFLRLSALRAGFPGQPVTFLAVAKL